MRFKQLAPVVALVAVLAGCGSADPGQPDRLTRGGTLTVGIPAETPGFNPYWNSWSESGELVASAFYESLAAIGKDGKVHPYLAKSITPSADLRSYTIRLRPGIRFADGTPMNAEAVAYGLRQNTLPTSPHGVALNSVKRIVVLDPLTLRIDLTRPRSDLPGALAAGEGGAIASMKAAKADPDRLNTHPVGTGPFKFVSWKRDDEMVVERNPNWWRHRGGPSLDKVVFKVIPDPQARFDSLRSGQLDVAYLDAGRQLTQAKAAGLQGEIFEPDAINAITLNVAKPPFDNIHARRAVVAAIDRDAIAKVDNSTPADQVFTPSNSNHLKDLGYPAFDIEQAKAEAAAYERETGKPLKFTLSCIPGEAFSQLAQLEQAMLSKAGIDVTLKNQDFSSYVQMVFGGDYEAGCWRTDPMSNPDVVFGYSLQPVKFGPDGNKKSGYANATNFSSPEVQALLQRSGESADPEVRREAYQQISRILAQELPYAITDYAAVGLFHAPDIVTVPTKLPDGSPTGTISQSLSINNIDWTGYGT
jgi:peptide/nickel transport system substrate-binding protein